MTTERQGDVTASSEPSAALANARPEESAGIVLARARLAAELFGSGTWMNVGRYQILERLGAGGMGVVHAAYDPELDRGVALKLVEVADQEREGALTEAKALARVSHDNVVKVFDVGTNGDYIFIVMELLRGQTLRTWIEGRPQREIIDAYLQAGAALAAAHANGLVHRDFKPDNAIVLADGRVRVIDFGLACETDRKGWPAAVPAGTPGYMAPEQANGDTIAPAADQYSFCVALTEALASTNESPPRWLATVLERGSARDPGARYASMQALLRALARDPARVRRRWAVTTGTALLLATSAFLIGRTNAETASEAELCAGAELELDTAWHPAARAAALARITELGAYGRMIRPRLASALETYAEQWIIGRRAACRDHARGLQSDTLFDRRTACLERSRDAFATVGELLANVEPAALAEAPRAVAALPDPGTCSDITILLSPVEPPRPAIAADVERLQGRLTSARVRLHAGRQLDAREIATGVVAAARQLGYVPLLAEARLVEGHAVMKSDRVAAVPILREATTLAMASHADALVIESWARRAWAEGTTTDPAGALAGGELVEALARRTPAAQFARALLHNNIGGVELARDHRDRARDAFRVAVTEARGLSGTERVELINASANLAIVTDDRSAADKLLEQTSDELARLLGEEHPDVLLVRWVRATTTIERLPAAIDQLTRICEALELHPGLEARIGECWAELAYVMAERGDAASASAAIDRALPRFGRHDVPVEALSLRELLRGDARAAAKRCAESVAGMPPMPTDPWWTRLARATSNLCWGRALRRLGEPARARAALETAIAELLAVVRDHPGVAYELRLGRARVELALVLAASGVDARTVASAAHAWLQRIDGAPEDIAMLTRLL